MTGGEGSVLLATGMLSLQPCKRSWVPSTMEHILQDAGS